MYLKRICMSGFKSFADRVEFDFPPGVTCIVGPNGCGKSNVVDAFKWVLGEQSARSLRGRQMLDMIFNGSSSRKAAGMAQVDLVFDNGDRALPLDREEVTVSRKLFRSGESEYLLCKEPARLKDIRELFMDTGVGANAYAVIEQGKVDILLQSSPTDRRSILEEAAGISKYKARKKEAVRKLDRTEQNLLRAADVIDEVEKRLRSVKLQAGKARNFKEYDARLRELRASYSMAEYHRLSEAIAKTKAQVESNEKQAAGIRDEIERMEAESVQLSADADKLSADIGAREHELSRVRSDLAGQRERMEAAHSRIGEEEEHLRSAEARHQQQTTRLQQQQVELDAATNQASAVEQAIDEQHVEVESLSSREHELARESARLQAVLEDEKAGVIDLVRRSAQLHNEITALTRHSDSLTDQRGRLTERDAVISNELASLLERREALRGKLREVESLMESESKRLEEKKEVARRIDADHARLVDRLADEKERRSALRSRQQVLADLQNKMDGVGAGARRLLDRKMQGGRGAVDAVIGLVADVFETDIARAPIVEAAIGEHDQHLVVSDSRVFLSEPELAANLPERTTVLCLDRIGPVMNVADFSDEPGFVAPLIDFVRYDAAMELLARNLMAKTVVVDTLENALAMAGRNDAGRDAAGHRFVTLRGEVVEPDGRIRVGPPHSTASLISRMSELRSIDAQLNATEDKINQLGDELSQASAQLSHVQQAQQELRAAIYELHTARVETNAGLESVGDSVRRLTAEKPILASEVATIEHQLAEAAQRAASNEDLLTETQAASEAREAQVKKYEAELIETNEHRGEVAATLTEARVQAGKLAEQKASLSKTLAALGRGVAESRQAIAAGEQEMQQSRDRIENSQKTIAACQQKVTELQQVAAEVEATIAGLRESLDALRARREELAHLVRDQRTALAECEQQLQDRRMKLHESGIRRDELVDRVREELSIELAELYAEYEHTDHDWAAVENEIAELKQKIQRLGNINLDAIGEQEELEERHTFLTRQRDDLDESRRQLDKLIDELNATCRDRFMAAFEIIRDNFRELFRKLFGGGKADMLLEDPNDALECGIEIVARPPGKELQSISLMSGGEKSMTAIALLLAIFRSRPSPFSLLDEVDAALDEANNERFNGIIREFLDKSQFIVITHSKRTMGIGDQMYGVTMQEPGVSTRVSVKFDQSDAPVAKAG